jgi:hypothetical protein
LDSGWTTPLNEWMARMDHDEWMDGCPEWDDKKVHQEMKRRIISYIIGLSDIEVMKILTFVISSNVRPKVF